MLFLFSAFWLWLGAMLSLAHADHGGQTTLVLPLQYVKEQFDKGRKFSTVDLRPVEDYQKGHLPNALSLPLSELTARFKEIPTEDLVVLYCECPRYIAENVYRTLRGHGYRNLSVMAEGFGAWVQRGYPTER